MIIHIDFINNPKIINYMMLIVYSLMLEKNPTFRGIYHEAAQ